MSSRNVDRRRAEREELYVEEQVLAEQVNRIRRSRDVQESKALRAIADAQAANDRAIRVMESALRLSSMEGEALSELRLIMRRLSPEAVYA